MSMVSIIAIGAISLTELILFVVNQTTQFLLALLAVQRFLIYFLPRFEKHLIFSVAGFKWLLWILYPLFAVGVSGSFMEVVPSMGYCV
uniref:G_PROTEIN_RECEP_F1_2 domain-containing protein n=1 Tax=Caenorhabditis tropicalis TaxID=1561998 RepID=A0A1I7TH51_9PELO